MRPSTGLILVSAVLSLVAGCPDPGSRVAIYRSAEHVVMLDDSDGWNDIVLDGTWQIVEVSNPDALVLNLPRDLEVGALYSVYAGQPSLAPWSRPANQIGVSWGDQPDGPEVASGNVFVWGWQTSPGGVFVDLEFMDVTLSRGSGGQTAPTDRRVTFWAFRGTVERPSAGAPPPARTAPAR